MDKKTVHIVSHSHWDREWYMPFEKHHIKLVKLIDDLLELFEDENSGFCSFFLDGQTIVLEDYLAVRPENRTKLEKAIRDERLFIGPWYVLQDEFLTSSEANVRNLLVGLEQAREFGKVSMIGYFPDAFGNAGQMPQLLKQAGMDAVIFGRGVRPVGFNNEIDETGDYESVFSEMMWQSPDGSSLLGVLFANWYNNGMEVPTDPAQAKGYWDSRIANAERFASTGHLLMMNGCDHQPVQKDLAEAIKVAGELYPDIAFKHSNYHDFLAGVRADQQNALSTIKGELTSQDTDGWSTLVNTCSSRIYQKQMNRKAEVSLEKLAEPLSTIAHVFGGKYPEEWLRYSWKTLMQNHPHDSICGCSVDPVHSEMDVRFQKSLQVTEELITDAGNALAQQLDTSAFPEGSLPFVVMNTTGWTRSGVVSADIDLCRVYGDPHASFEAIKEQSADDWTVVDEKGNAVPCTIENLGRRFGYDLPDDRFRQPYRAQALRATFEAEDVPAAGWRTYALVKTARSSASSLVTGQNQMENDAIKAVINPDGTVDMTYKATGRTYKGLCGFEDTGDIANEYIYRQPNGDQAILTAGVPADSIELVEDTPYSATYAIKRTMRLPISADAQLQEEQQAFVHFHNRQAKRSTTLVDFPILTELTLEKNGRSLLVKVTFDNQSKDHRLRMLFPTELVTDVHLADSIFEAVERPNRPAPCWTNPSNCQHQQYFVSVDDGKDGLTVANFGLNEYEVLPDDRNAIAVTILRSVGELGDWGCFPTPDAQCIGPNTVELALIPHAGGGADSGAFAQAHQFQVGMPVFQTGVHAGKLPAEDGFFSFEGTTLALTAVKENAASGDLILRWCNLSPKSCELVLHPNFDVAVCYQSNVVEDTLEPIPQDTDGGFRRHVGGAEIVTLRLKRA